MRKEIGPMSFDEKKLLCISIGLLALWATGVNYTLSILQQLRLLQLPYSSSLKLALWTGSLYSQTSTGDRL